MVEHTGDNILIVQMFGGFSMTWNGRSVTGGSKSGETQFNYLMQILLHNRREGVSRERRCSGTGTLPIRTMPPEALFTMRKRS